MSKLLNGAANFGRLLSLGMHCDWRASIAFLLLFSISGTARSEAPVSVSAEGWTVTANPDRGVFSASHEALGAVLVDASFDVHDSMGTHAVGKWTAKRGTLHQLVLRSTESRIGWVIELRRDILIISSTSRTTTLRAAIPAPQSLMQARLLDPEGTPVNWVGNDEVEGLYGGHETATPSFLPRTNSDVIYFSLGRITSPAFHSLFDRKRDIAIDFPPGSILAQSPGSPALRDLTLPVPGNAVIRVTRDYYTQTLHVPYYVPFDDRYFPTAPIVWSSWVNYYEGVREEDIVRNTDWLAANLKPYGFGYVELDDGYDRMPTGEHSWIDNWNKQAFPHGPQWLASYIKSKGLHAGIWLVPNSYAKAAQTHPDWYLRDKSGKFVLDYSTPALDSTNPAVMEHLRNLFRTLGAWGFEYYKFDGEHSVAKYAPVVDRTRLYNTKVDLLENYRDRLKTIRDTVGPHVFLEGCPAGTPLNGIGYFNSYFTGDDLYSNWQGMYPLFSSITANVFLNHVVTYVMPGEGLELGAHESIEAAAGKRSPLVIKTAREREDPLTGIGTTLAEARTLVTYVALTGVVYPLASVMPELPEARLKLLQATMPTLPIVPVDLFSRGTDAGWDKFRHVQADYYVHNYPDILDLKINGAAGDFDVVALTNWRSVPETRRVKLEEKLGLPANKSYVVFDFWNQKDLGVIDEALEANIEAHDTRVLFVHPLLDTPQLVGISRHVSGTYSVQSVTWNAAQNLLRGRSDAPADEPYTIWIHLPQGFRESRVTAHAGTSDIAVTHSVTDRSLMVRFRGRHEPVDWQVEFTPPAGGGSLGRIGHAVEHHVAAILEKLSVRS
ncbi:MAG: alpha-galactosidase [Gammaproteobacteria bacterium]|nr:alpha-galactosidase [Gammaproteobacteria bacterium]